MKHPANFISEKEPTGPIIGHQFNRSGAAPLYRELANWLEQKIRSGEYAGSEKIPGDSQLSDQLGVSIITVRAAMKLLIEKQLVVRYPGKGTYTREKNSTPSVWGLGTVEDLIAIGFHSSVKLLNMANIVAPKWVADKFSLSGNKKIFWCQTLRSRNREPFVLNDVYLPLTLGAALMKINLANELKKKRLVNTIVQETSGVFISDIHQCMGAELANSKIAKLLRVPEGAPLLTVERYYFSIDKELVQIGRSYNRVDNHNYGINLKRVTSS